MRRTIEKLMNLSNDSAFFIFQQNLIKDMYYALGQGFSSNENEISLVKRLISAINGKSFKGIHLFADILHGSRSYVEFNYLDKPVTKELGDMLVISLITSGTQRLFQRLCIIQNKKDKDGKWVIDHEQLYLLKNFPSFTGNKGIFRRNRDLIFRNNSGCLGAFGLFLNPGEQILASASLLAELLHGRNAINFSDISVLPHTGYSRNIGLWSWFPFFGLRHPKELFFILEELLPHYGWNLSLSGMWNGFLGNTYFCRDIHDFTKDWTQMNIGEPTFAFDRILNPHVDAFTNSILRKIKYKPIPELPSDDIFGDADFDSNVAIMLMHLDIEKEK